MDILLIFRFNDDNFRCIFDFDEELLYRRLYVVFYCLRDKKNTLYLLQFVWMLFKAQDSKVNESFSHFYKIILSCHFFFSLFRLNNNKKKISSLFEPLLLAVYSFSNNILILCDIRNVRTGK